ncbi:MAG: 6-phosphofructokinase [Clostridia bacterium]|nr:6-phosphofructokinase [Clostridia bacterium]
MRRIAVLTSGGDAPGMNAAIRAVVRKGIYEGLEVFGIEHGYAGLIRGEFQAMDRRSVADIIHRGGTVLFTARSEAFKSPEGQAEAVAQLRRHQIDGLVVIGGDGSFRGAAALEEHGVWTVGVPGTIDNDLAGTDTTIGFDTAVNTAIQAIDRIRDTATAHERTFVVEVMGRNSGFIALMAGLADGAESILVPEEPTDLETVCERVQSAYRSGKRHSIIVVAEGAARGFEVAQRIQERTGLDTRVTVLGHIQRGGAPTAMDRLIASQLGAAAVDALLQGRHGCMAGLVHGRVRLTPYEQVLAASKDVDRETYRLAAILAI